MKSTQVLLLCLVLLATGLTEPRAQDTPAKAFENVTIHTADGNTIDNGTIIWRNGIIEKMGTGIQIPFDAYVIDGGDSLHIYPGFLDGMATWGSPDLPDQYETPDRPGEPSYERAGIQPQRHPSNLLNAKDSNLSGAQKKGFTTALLGLKGFMLPGQLDLFFLNGRQTGDYLFSRGKGILAKFEDAPGAAYPNTLMGMMAKYRQLWYDAEALQQQKSYFATAKGQYPAPLGDEVLEALVPVMNREQPLYFVVDTKENIDRLLKLQDELNFSLVIVSGKEAYARTDQLKSRKIPVLASIDLPEKPDWKVKEEKAERDTAEVLEEREEITEEMRIFRKQQMAAYKASVENIRKLMEAGVKVGYATNEMKLSDFRENLATLRKEGGLTDQQILAMLTRNTAEILGVNRELGGLQPGQIASFSLFTKPFEAEKTEIKYSISGGIISEFDVKTPSKNKENDE
ncbi:MAG: amidohydrolase family protein [Balneolaceae bacterium]|nr:amidohydrolase family protein [Balneolaceae bacterium]